ncbi:ABC transporter ATP-binding protein/permease [Phascolarctobacterium succinatutens]|uniref:ABC transporter, ATP-binding protein n=1 Tax=Phascolarctobacterium succinatutens YIT 12067 TaxID=626939 RepID=E8LC29_9FIRM|nr:ABC transporter ATP-binding protein/permease [Phascolarctobacterium succinatutens]EFY05635.1 ABC transporter, ATP-binding protein [Phascolarctobacterium succinatutens YIT 12067]MCI6544164.1 ABC transporter ATP-binding protein/permease [Phascolarctobacterium succinatutens]
MQRFNLTRQFFRDVWYLTKSYWQSEEKKKAFFLLGCIIALTLGVVYMLVLLNQWNNSFYSALQNYDAKKIFDELIHFSWLAAIYILLAVYSYYLQQTLILNWRRWLTTRFIDIWLQNKTYYNLQMFGKDTDNPDQRISEDVRQFVEMTLSFGIGILKAFCTFASFVVILYNLSGSLSFTFMGKTWTINGYMLWASLLYSVIGTYITHIVGRKLVKINFIQQKYEADFRFSMIRLRESAESVAFYRGEAQEGSVFKQRFKMLLDNFWKLVNKQKQLVFLNSGYSQIAIIFPFVVAMNRYLTKEVTLGGLMQVASAFGRVQDSLSYFVDMYSSIAQWQAVVMRLTCFGHHMHDVYQQAERFHVERFAAADVVEVNNMQINLPDGKPLLENISFTLHPGHNVLIKGVSGSGKSTLLRAISGIWPFVDGKIFLPERDKLMFIPQRSYLPLGTLRAALNYPGNKPIDDTELIYLMDLCQIGYLKDKLDLEADWSHVLSVGEQQRLAFVRAHIQQPQWLFLDEATSALDEDTEANMYSLLQERLQQTTVVSVGHRSTLNKYHELVLRLNKSTRQVTLEKL